MKKNILIFGIMLCGFILSIPTLANERSTEVENVIELQRAIDTPAQRSVIYLSQDIIFKQAKDSINIPEKKEVILDAQGHTIDCNQLNRAVSNSGRLTLLHLTIQNGKSINGGAIYNSGILNCEDVKIMHNFATTGSGGGIYNSNSLDLENSTLEDNKAEKDGGGVFNDSSSKAEIRIETSNFLDNVANQDGGAIKSYPVDSLYVLRGNLFRGNSALGNGGGINCALSNRMKIKEATFVQNKAGHAGGSVYVPTLEIDKELFNETEEVFVDLSTVHCKENVVENPDLRDKSGLTNVNEFTFLGDIQGKDLLGKAYVIVGRSDIDPIGLQNITQLPEITHWQTGVGENTIFPDDLASYLKSQTEDKTFYSDKVNLVVPQPDPKPDPNPNPKPTLPSTEAPKPNPVAASKVAVSGKKIVAVKKSIQLKAIVSPANATNKKVTWSTSNKKIATVDKNGKVKAKKAGVVIITAKTANKKTATFRVTVTDKHTKKKSIKVKKGQSLAKIAKQLKIKDWRNLWSWNDKIKTPNRLTKAQKLVYYVFK